MNIKELASKYELTENDFWELRKGTNKWIITHDACEKIAVTEGIMFDPPEIINYTPTIITENGEKVQKPTKWGTQTWKPAWAGTCQRKTGDVAMIITGYKQDNPDYKVWATGEADASNCVITYFSAMAEKRGKCRVILTIIDAYKEGIYSDVEAGDFEKKEKKPTAPQLEKLHNLADDLGYKLMGVNKMNKEEVSAKIDELQDEVQNRESEEHAIKQQELIKES